jgi:cell division septum initiation protein DivIVA
MEKQRLLSLALEQLEKQKRQVEADMEDLRAEITGGPTVTQAPSKTAPSARKGKERTAAQRRAHSQRMRAYWAEKRAQVANARKTHPGKPKRRPKTAAEKKALSLIMKKAWARRKAAAASKER